MRTSILAALALMGFLIGGTAVTAFGNTSSTHVETSSVASQHFDSGQLMRLAASNPVQCTQNCVSQAQQCVSQCQGLTGGAWKACAMPCKEEAEQCKASCLS
jgi:hypothetical protein